MVEAGGVLQPVRKIIYLMKRKSQGTATLRGYDQDENGTSLVSSCHRYTYGLSDFMYTYAS